MRGFPFAWLVCAGITFSAAADAQTGYVLEVQGRWVKEGADSDAIAQGQSVKNGDVLRWVSDGRNPGLIVVASGAGEVVVRRTCPAQGNCESAKVSIAQAHSQGLLERLFAAVMSRFQQEPATFVSPNTRGEDDFEGVVNVIVRRGKSLDVTELFRDFEDGTYWLQFGKRLDGRGQAIAPVLVKFESATTSVAIDLPSGLYRTTIRSFATQAIYESWTLARTESAARTCRRALSDACSLARRWGDKVTEHNKGDFIRGYLYSLAIDGGDACPADDGTPR